MPYDDQKFEDDMQKTKEILAVREAFLQMDGDFDCVDLFNFLRKKEMSDNIPIDNISDILEKFCEKGEVEVVEKSSPTKYRRIIEPE